MGDSEEPPVRHEEGGFETRPYAKRLNSPLRNTR